MYKRQALGSRGSCNTLNALATLRTCRALRSRRAGIALGTLGTGGARVTLGTLGSWVALIPFQANERDTQPPTGGGFRSVEETVIGIKVIIAKSAFSGGSRQATEDGFTRGTRLTRCTRVALVTFDALGTY